MMWQPTGQGADGRWVKHSKQRRFHSAVAPCRSDREAERVAWAEFEAFRTRVHTEAAEERTSGRSPPAPPAGTVFPLLHNLSVKLSSRRRTGSLQRR